MARAGLRSHLSGTVPISIAAHLFVLLLLLIIPLAADVVLPIPAAQLPEFIRVSPLPPPPAVVVRQQRPAAAPQASQESQVPLVAPSAIRPESPDPGPQFDLPGADPNGLPGFGTLGGITAPPPLPVAEPPKVSSAVRAAQLPQSPRKTLDVRPVYPDIARSAHVEGTVVLEALLDTAGRVTQLRVIKSVPLLDEAALEAVRQWRYTPSLYGGHPVSVLMTITIRFTLQP
jgi:protein TonB